MDWPFVTLHVAVKHDLAGLPGRSHNKWEGQRIAKNKCS